MRESRSLSKQLARRAIAMAVIFTLAGCAGQALPKGDYGTVHGIVKSTSGAAVQGATITIDTVLTASTDASGSYTVPTVPADDANSSTAVYCNPPPGYVAPPPQSVKVVSGQTTEADFTVQLQ